MRHRLCHGSFHGCLLRSTWTSFRSTPFTTTLKAYHTLPNIDNSIVRSPGDHDK